MTNENDYKHWTYEFTHYVPVTPRGGGEIQWRKISDHREIYLPSDVSDPREYLQQTGSDEFVDLLEYSDFNTLD
jgi:hypothetical protein